MKRVHDEGAGVYEMQIVGPTAALELTRQALNGDRAARRLLLILEDCVKELIARPADNTALCLTCDNEFTSAAMPALFVVMHAYRDDPSAAVANGICWPCFERFKDSEELQQAVMAVWRNSVSDMRVLPPLSRPGHG